MVCPALLTTVFSFPVENSLIFKYTNKKRITNNENN